jgi:hypothetical protein
VQTPKPEEREELRRALCEPRLVRACEAAAWIEERTGQRELLAQGAGRFGPKTRCAWG